MQRRGRRLAVTALAAALFALILAGCGSGEGEEGADPTRVLARGPTSAVDGYAPIVVPLSPRQNPTIVAAGNFIFVYGGHFYDKSADKVRPRGDGAVYDVAKGEWTTLPVLPFDDPLFSSSGAWTGSEVVITGTPCAGPPKTEGDWFDCHPGGHAIAAYSPTKRTWRVIENPPGLTTDVGGETIPVVIRAYGFANGRVVFDASVSVHEPRRWLLLDPITGASKLLTEPIADMDTVCVIGQKLIAAHTGVANPGPILTFELDATLEWKRLPDYMRDPVEPALFRAGLHCSPQHLMYLPVVVSPAGLDAGALWYLPDQQRWEALPRFGPIGLPAGEPSSLDGTRAFWVGNGEEMFLLPAGANDWIPVKRPPGGGVFLVGELDHAILMRRIDEEPARTTVVLFDPNALLKSAG